ncbi:MAG: hypothetical protein IT437_05990, partial [Phycisphaerales bacterium]|nr:hypothetical protein [Phycisphaerales bacterium]
MAVYTFKANETKSGAAFVISGTGTVSQTFARNVATVDPDDDAVGANVARRDRP